MRSASPARSSTIRRLRRINRRSWAARRSSGSGVPDDSLGTAVRRAAEAISGEIEGGRRWPIAGGLRGTTMSASYSTGCRISASTDAPSSAGSGPCSRRRPLGWRHGRAHHAGSRRGDAGGCPRSGRPPGHRSNAVNCSSRSTATCTTVDLPPGQRPGLRLGDLSDEQLEPALGLLQLVHSVRGWSDTQLVIRIEAVRRAIAPAARPSWR